MKGIYCLVTIHYIPFPLLGAEDPSTIYGQVLLP